MAGSNFDSENQTENQDDSMTFSSINITPFVDVMLVLLVIFMITAPLLIKDIIDIRLPKTTTSDGQKVQTMTLGIVINKEEQILLNGVIVDDDSLKNQVQNLIKNNSSVQAVISADVNLPYGKVVRLIDMLKVAGLEKFAVQIEKETDEKNK